MKRFLRYSLERQKAIRVMWLAQGQAKTVTLRVTQLLPEGFMATVRNKQVHIPYTQVLSAGYARGDSGE